MTLQIHPVTEIDASDLRNLVIDNLGSLLGEDARLVEAMPQLDGCCLATSDAQDGPVLLSFDAADPRQALLTGLAWMDQLGSDMAALFLQQYQPPARLLVLAPAAPPGATLFGESCPVGWRRIQILSVNDELGMVIDPVVDEGAAGTGAVTPLSLERRPTIVESVLNPEEEQHFSQL
ncbi:MAG: hypothetical protein PVJ15_04600 [Gammaproteobacteria bacterium]|jgi:hypothetical protein